MLAIYRNAPLRTFFTNFNVASRTDSLKKEYLICITATTVTPMFPDCCSGQNACAHCCARPAGTESRSRTRSRSSDVGRWLETWVDHANRCHCFCAIATVTIMIITWNTREPGNNDDEITREWMCLLRFNECGVGNYL